MRARTLQTRPHDHFTSGFQDPRGSAEVLGTKFWVAQAMPVALQILKAVAGFREAGGVPSQRSGQTLPAAVIQFLMPTLSLAVGFLVLYVEGLSHLAQMLLDVVTIHD